MNSFINKLRPFCSLIFIFSLCTFLRPDSFLTVDNIVTVLCRSSFYGIMAAGMTYVIITGGIDLSVGSMFAMCGMFGAAAMLFFSGGSLGMIASSDNIHLTLPAMIGGTLVSVLIGAFCGFANGMLITRLKLAPFIVTLGTMSLFRGISYVMNNTHPIELYGYTWLNSGRILGIPSSIVLLVIIMTAAGFLLKCTRFGRYTYAIGSNTQTAFHAGVNVNKTLVWIYTLTGALVGIAAMIGVSRINEAAPGAGQAYELDVIAAAIIGGCAPSGGRGTMLGTVIGTLLIAFIRNGLNLFNIDSNVQFIVIGLIIIVAVTADQFATRRKAT